MSKDDTIELTIKTSAENLERIDCTVKINSGEDSKVVDVATITPDSPVLTYLMQAQSNLKQAQIYLPEEFAKGEEYSALEGFIDGVIKSIVQVIDSIK